MTQSNSGRLAVVTGASSGIGRELARRCAEDGFDLLIAADDAEIQMVASDLRCLGVQVESIQADLSTEEGVDGLCEAIGDRPVDALLANAGIALGRAFHDQGWQAIRRVIDTNVVGTTYLARRLIPPMRARGSGRILFTGSIAGFIPGAFMAVYNGTKAYINSFAVALRNELKDSGVTVTVLMPGATDTHIFDRAGMLDTRVATSDKDDPSDVAKVGFDAMIAGDAEIIAGFKNKLQVAVARVAPAPALAELHRKMAEPGTGKEQ